jgi:hypothetical protein
MFFLPSGTTVSGVSNGYLNVHGTRRVIQQMDGISGDIPPGGQRVVRLSVGGTALPSGCTINGAPCSGGDATGDVVPPTEVTDLRLVDGVLYWRPARDNVAVYRYNVHVHTSTDEARYILGTDFDPDVDGWAVPDLTDVQSIEVRVRDNSFNYSQPRSIRVWG